MDPTKIYMVYRSVPGYISLLIRYGFIDDDKALKIEDFANQYERKIREQNALWRDQSVDPWEDVDVEEKREAKVRFLEKQKKMAQRKIIKLKEEVGVIVYGQGERGEYKKKYKQLGKQIKHIKKIQKVIHSVRAGADITELEIERARKYPIEKIVKVYRDRARCIAHDDTNPSMYTKNNFVHCFSCGYSGDVIDVAMRVHRMTFVEAVKFLCI